MRTELIAGRHLLCGTILPINKLAVGQLWASADGSDHVVSITAISDGWVSFTWTEHGAQRHHEKTSFAFQCRYCLVVDGPETPEEFT